MSIRQKDLRAIAAVIGQEMGEVQQGIDRGAIAPNTIKPLNMVANRIGNWFSDERIPGYDEGTWFGLISDSKEETLRQLKQGASR